MWPPNRFLIPIDSKASIIKYIHAFTCIYSLMCLCLLEASKTFSSPCSSAVPSKRSILLFSRLVAYLYA